VEDLAPQLDAACDGDWSPEKLLEIGERIWNLERQFNNSAGFTAADDKLPQRLMKDAAKTGPAKGLTSKLDEMLPEYYGLRGWTPDGVPTNETIQRLNL
jgi:aldehyde:ferredoxin oxidoreductase